MINSNVYNYTKCPICGESEFKHNEDGSLICKICNLILIPCTSEIKHQLFEALTAREIYDFDRADQIYQNIINKTNDEKIKAMCEFGRLLSYFGIVYIKDFNKNLILTISKYHPNINSIKETSYYANIKSSSYFNIYQDQLEALDIEYKRLNEELKKDFIYDVFICTKISMKTKNNPEAEGYTDDSHYALSLYNHLNHMGLNVFYSDKCLKGIDYDSQIFSALIRSRNIIVLTTKKDYLESPWVESEWRRWLNLTDCNLKEKNSLYLYLPKGNNIELPSKLSRTQIYTDSSSLVDSVEANVKKQMDIADLIEKLDVISTSINNGDYYYNKSDFIEKVVTLKSAYEVQYKEISKNLNLDVKVRKYITCYNESVRITNEINDLMTLGHDMKKHCCKEVYKDYNDFIYENGKELILNKKLISNIDNLFLINDLMKFESEIITKIECFSNYDVIEIAKACNQLWKKYDNFIEEHKKVSNFNSTLGSFICDQIIKEEDKLFYELDKIITEVKKSDSFYNINNFEKIKTFKQIISVSSQNFKEKNENSLKELCDQAVYYFDKYSKMKQEVLSITKDIDNLTQGSRKITRVKKKFDILTPEQQKDVINIDKLNKLVNQYSEDRIKKFQLVNRINLISSIILISLGLLSLFVKPINVMIINNISLSDCSLISSLLLLVINIIISLYLKLNYGSKKNKIFNFLDK